MRSLRGFGVDSHPTQKHSAFLMEVNEAYLKAPLAVNPAAVRFRNLFRLRRLN